MKNNSLDNLMIKMTQSFYNLSDSIAKGEIIELAPPFNSYLTFDGDIISFFDYFFKRYDEAFSSIDKNEIERISIMMSSLVEKASGKKATFNLLSDIASVETVIGSAMTHYFKGFPSLALDSFEEGMLANNMHLFNLLPQIEITGGDYYRVAKANRCIKNRKDLFHVPFDKRGYCATYRYSVLGYPSLYLSERLSVAKLETGIKPLKSYYAICFKTRKTCRFIDLALTQAFNTIWERYSLLTFYPLIMACGLTVREPDKPFKPEYVIPQILSQVVRLHMLADNPFDGISYVSTKVKRPDFMDMNMRNYVVWIKGADQENGFSSSLADKFISSAPLKSCGLKSSDKVENVLKQSSFKKII